MRLLGLRPKGCCNTLREINRVPSIAAVFPFKLDDQELSLSKPRLLYCIFVLSVISAQASMLLRRPDQFYLSSPIAYLVYCVEQISVKVTLFIALHCLVRSRKALKKIVSLLCQVERSLKDSGLTWTMKIDYTHDVVVFVFLILVCTLHITMRTKDIWTFSKMTTYYFTMALLYAVTIQFKRLVLFAATGFKLIHYCLTRVVHSKYSYHKLTQTENMVMNYHKLYKVCLLLNAIYSPQILLIIFSSFLIAIGNIYFFYQSLIGGGGFAENLLKFSWLVFYSAISLHMVWPCSLIDEQAKEFNTLLYQLMIDDTSNDISNNRKLRLHIAMKREVVFTACGFFTLDYTLVHSMIAAATTYLVILIQFGQPTTSNNLQANSFNATELSPFTTSPS